MSDDGGQRSDSQTTAHFREEFGAQFGAMQNGLLPDEEAAVAALPAGSALLIVRRGPNAGARFLLDTDVAVVGRHPDADIFLDDVTVSRRHAEFRRIDGQFHLIDLGSLNGSYCDGEHVTDAVLADGSEVQVGKFKMTFYASRHPAAPESGAA